jgi:hypothetical protein
MSRKILAAVATLAGGIATSSCAPFRSRIGLFLAHLLGLTFAIALVGFFYRRKIFLRV